ncbi:hypothetical protein WR25_10855 isoform B [Diploscapter pachys]|uniref:GIY-YIG domain-containing protein n=1 Tax=Diploscapter pachys TaxID=2018661 RepID=A0A2A2LBR4_9BILA|nr:hypothetical protein WR25_10855 isoform B [Diploscapter pachys]
MAPSNEKCICGGKMRNRTCLCKTKGVVYMLECNCGDKYIGITVNKVKARLQSHYYAVKNREPIKARTGKYRSALAVHADKCNRWSNSFKVTLIARATGGNKQKAAEILRSYEAAGIKIHNPSINRRMESRTYEKYLEFLGSGQTHERGRVEHEDYSSEYCNPEEMIAYVASDDYICEDPSSSETEEQS